MQCDQIDLLDITTYVCTLSAHAIVEMQSGHITATAKFVFQRKHGRGKTRTYCFFVDHLLHLSFNTFRASASAPTPPARTAPTAARAPSASGPRWAGATSPPASATTWTRGEAHGRGCVRTF